MINKHIILIILVLIIILVVISSRPIENYDTKIDEGIKEYDDALEKRIGEVKKKIPGSDAELLLEVNRPYQADKIDELGWYGDVINCKKNGSLNIYCKPKNKWIWPY